MAATPIETTGPDTPATVLAALETNHSALAQHEVGQFRLAVDWAAAHPAEDLDTAATIEGTEGELAIAGPGAPLVAEFCIADFALAVGMSTDAGRTYLGDAVEVHHRLPRLWARVMSGAVPVWRARRIAAQTRTLPPTQPRMSTGTSPPSPTASPGPSSNAPSKQPARCSTPSRPSTAASSPPSTGSSTSTPTR